MNEKFRNGYQVMSLYEYYSSLEMVYRDIEGEVFIPEDNLGFDIDQLITVLRQGTPQPKIESKLVKKEITKFKL